MRIQNIILFFGAMLFSLTYSLQAQVEQHTKEQVKVSTPTAKVGDEVDIIVEVDIDARWYIYGTEIKVEGPSPTTLKLKPHPSFQAIGKVQTVGMKQKYDKVWEGDITYFEQKAVFKQRIKVLQAALKAAGELEYLCCSTIDGRCLPPAVYEFTVDNKLLSITPNRTEEQKNTAPTEDKPKDKSEARQTTTDSLNQEKKISSDTKRPDNPRVVPIPSPESSTTSSLWTFALLAALAGFAALLTPCVFPMIPMTVAFFTRNRKKAFEGLNPEQTRALERKFRREAIQKALFYAGSIVLIYTILGTLVAWINGPAFANWISTHWLPNIFFFIISVVFALSFLGMYEIVLPSSWVNKAATQEDKGGLYGIFFMALTLALVSFSCTGPIVGQILVQSAGGEVLKPIIGMLAFSSALAFPFALFAVFPEWLNSLPKSGGWLNTVKVTLGFLELALALKFLSIADQVYHWGILDREVFLAMWITIFGMLGFYLLGKLRMPHDSPVERLPVPRAMLALITLSFTMYLIPGMFGAPLRPLAGYLPPRTTMQGEDLYAVVENSTIAAPVGDFPKARFSEFLKLPHGLKGFFDFKQAVQYAQEMNKPIFIDFTGHGCVNCREMEEAVWSAPEVLRRLKQDFVVVALYVDDRTELPESEWYTSKYDQKTKKTIGQQNTDLQITKFNNNAQPYYCLVSPKGELLAQPLAYDKSVDNFVAFLERGKAAYQKTQLARR